MTALFPLGQIVATPSALTSLAQSNLSALDLLSRHASGDFGNLNEEDRRENFFSIQHGFRILSSYHSGGGKLYIITEANRAVTTILLASEY